MMKNYLLFIITFFALAPIVSAQSVNSKLEKLMDYYASEYHFNGVALVANKSGLLLEKAYGYRDISKKIKHDNFSIFPIGTLTSQFTVELILQLAAEHKLSIDDSLGKFFPGYSAVDTCVDIHMLLTSSTGMNDYAIWDAFMKRHDTGTISRDSLFRVFMTQRPPIRPGLHSKYCHSNYLLLAYIVELVTHESYSEALRNQIFKPVGMVSSGLDYVGLKDSHKSTGYRYYNEHNPIRQSVADSSLLEGSANMYSTINDLYAWHLALQSYKLLDSAWQELAYKPQGNSKYNYASGWYIDTVFDKRTLTFAGQLQGFSSYIYRIPEDGLCIILLQNLDRPAYENKTIGENILACLYGKDYKIPEAIPPMPLSIDSLKQYEGEYDFNKYFTIMVKLQGDKLHVKVISTNELEKNDYDIIPIAENLFKTYAVPGTIEFFKDATGQVYKLIVHLPKMDAPGMKKKQL